MFWNKWVKVRFIEAETERSLGESTVAFDRLPQSFEVHTVINLRDESWEVVRAEPLTRAEYSKSRKLTLTLKRLDVMTLAPGELLYSLPTISDALPAVEEGSSKEGRDVLELHEDDWRQVEVVSRANESEVRADLEQIRHIHDTASLPGGGFTKIHLRKGVASPLRGAELTRGALEGAIPSLRRYEGLAWRGEGELIAGGFAYDARGIRLFGTENGGLIDALCLLASASPGPDLPVDALARLMQPRGLELVDWCRARRVAGTESSLREYFTPRAE